MTKDIWIRITAFHRGTNTEPEQMDMSVPGKYYFRNGKHYVEYEEADPERGETSKSRISFREACLEIRKTGACQSRLIFEENRRNRSQYHTPFGILTAETDVKSLRISEDENQIVICVDYALALNGEKTADSSVCIQVTAKPVGYGITG